MFTTEIFTERSIVFFMFSKLINAVSIRYLKSNDQYNYQEEQSSVCKLQIQNFKWKNVLHVHLLFFLKRKY